MSKHVYILGAGFSVPLGGPLFTQLLTLELSFQWQKLRIDEPWRSAISKVHEPQWQQDLFHRRLNAEELLERLDWLTYNSSLPIADAVASVLKPVALGNVNNYRFFQQFNHLLKQVLACECEEFLDELDKDSDRWTPYVRWFKQLTDSDTIITFNYDTAVERIAERTGRPFDRNRLCKSDAPRMPRLIKLHGSTDWEEVGDAAAYQPHGYYRDIAVAIGIPGRQKAMMHSDGLFAELWHEARHAIEHAQLVSIVGYSMPPTDNNARMMILDAIAKGREEKKLISLVVGPSSGTIAAKRMVALIDPHVRCEVVDLPLYAQDFLPHVRDHVTFHKAASDLGLV